MKKRLHASFRGRVQGVGFRFTTERIARHFKVTGCVRNLPNGKVELVAEGEEQALVDFLKALREGPMSHYIEDIEIEWSEALGNFTEFGIGY